MIFLIPSKLCQVRRDGTKCRRIGEERTFCYNFLLPRNCDFYGVLLAPLDASLFAIKRSFIEVKQVISNLIRDD